jgi:hypothetical protein
MNIKAIKIFILFIGGFTFSLLYFSPADAAVQIGTRGDDMQKEPHRVIH